MQLQFQLPMYSRIHIHPELSNPIACNIESEIDLIIFGKCDKDRFKKPKR